LRAAGIEVRDIKGAEAAERGVERLWAFTGPKRLRFELFTRPLAGAGPLAIAPVASSPGPWAWAISP